ncbi:leucine-rich repeat protein [Akkermansiaceae bacterium]|nr:leucine-rich repeat protein [bacterium]MDB4395749.1 leucine-rich repeat protein [Akkermansiaceae bacterium]
MKSLRLSLILSTLICINSAHADIITIETIGLEGSSNGGVAATLEFEISNNEVTILDCNPDASGTLIIDDLIAGEQVTSIGQAAFGNTNLTRITIPDSVTKLGANAFAACFKLKSVILSENLTSILQSTFNSTTSLTSIKIPDKVASIESNSFLNCSNLESVIIGTGVTNIEGGSFADCTKLQRVFFRGKAPELERGFRRIGAAPKAYVYANNLSSFGEEGSDWNGLEITLITDSDGDGLPDYAETNSGIFNSIEDTGTDPENSDTDGDGLTDYEEVENFKTNPLAIDSDADGFSDKYELDTSYDPNSAESVPDAFVEIMTAIEIKFTASLGATYSIEFSTDNQNWSILEGDIVGEGGAVERLYSKQDYPTGFFRVERKDQ